MPKTYNQEAVELARKLYCKYGGKNYDAIQKEMRLAGYVGWQKSTLFNRGKDENKTYRVGWIEKFGFENSLQEFVKTQVFAVTDDVQKLYLGIKAVRENLQTKATGKEATRDDFYAFRDFAKLEMDARAKLDLAKDNYESFATCFEKMLAWLPDIDEKAALAFLSGDTAERVLERARIEYGEEKQSES